MVIRRPSVKLKMKTVSMRFLWIKLKGKVKLSLCLINLLRTTAWRRMREWRYSSTILNLGTKWRWVASFAPRLFCPPPPVGEEDGWVSGLVWTMWRREKFVVPAGNRTPAAQTLVRRYNEWAEKSFLKGEWFNCQRRKTCFHEVCIGAQGGK
jgi:hypothetical protein